MRQGEVVGHQSQAVDLGGGDNGRDNTAELVPLPALQQSQDAGGKDVWESRRYPGIVSR